MRQKSTADASKSTKSGWECVLVLLAKYCWKGGVSQEKLLWKWRKLCLHSIIYHTCSNWWELKPSSPPLFHKDCQVLPSNPQNLFFLLSLKLLQKSVMLNTTLLFSVRMIMSWGSFSTSGKGVLVWKPLGSLSVFDAFISKLISPDLSADKYG